MRRRPFVHVTVTVFAVASVLLVAGCRKGTASAPPTPDQLVGRWQLVDANGRGLAELGLARHVLTFGADGSLKFESALGGDGTQVSGSGTWRLEGGTLIYVVGDNEGSVSVTMQGDDLHLAADPVLRIAQDGAT